MVDKIHTDVLKQSDKSCLEGCAEIEDKFLRVCKKYARVWGVELLVPDIMKPDFIRWRTLVKRYNKGDFRHTDSELRSLKEIAQWTVDTNAALCKQPTTKIQWRS